MKVATPYRCDECKADKKATNHWWLLFAEKPVTEGHVAEGWFRIHIWDERMADQEGVQHICSEACAVKALSKWLGGGK